MLTLLKQSLAKHAIQTAAMIISVAMSVMAILAVILVSAGVTAGIEASSERSGAQFLVVPREAADEIDDSALLFTGAPVPFYLSRDIASNIEEIDGVTAVSAQFFTQTLNASCCSTDTATRLIGVDFSTDWTVQPFCDEKLPDTLDDRSVIVGADVAGEKGETIYLLGEAFTVYAKLAPSGGDLDDSLLLDIDAARALAKEQPDFAHFWNKFGQPEDLVSCILFDVGESAQKNVVINKITAQGGVSVIERSAVVADAQKDLESILTVVLCLSAMMLVSTTVQLFARFFTCVWDRKSELALYRAIGATRGDIRRLIGGEIALVVGVGLCVGIALGFAFESLLVAIMTSSSAFPFITPEPMEMAGAVGIVVGVFAVLAVLAVAWPLYQIGRIDPSLAMQQGDID